MIDAHHQVEIHIAAGDGAQVRLAAGAAVLDAQEQARAARLHFDADRTLYRAAHVLLRRALSGQVPLPPAAWRFVRGAHGRPEIDRTACPGAGGLRFSLAHTRGLVCCALVQALPVGIDAECRRPLPDARAIAEGFFAPEEAAAVAAAGPPGSAAEAATFRALWTLNEAYIKALGLGLSMELDGFAFRLAGGVPREILLRSHANAEHPAAHWRCLLLDVDDARCTVAVTLPAAVGARFRVLLHGAGSGRIGTHVNLIGATPGDGLASIEVAAEAGLQP